MVTPVSPRDTAPPGAVIAQMALAFRQTQTIYAAAALGLADLLAAGSRGADDLAAATGAHAPSLRRLLRALASFGVVAEEPDGRFALTVEGACLRADAPGSLRATVLLSGSSSYRTWGELPHSVRTGESAFQRAWGLYPWDFYARHPERAALFDAAMAGLSTRETGAIVAAYDFGAFETIVDVGGGTGTLLQAILGANPGLRGVLFDRPQVVAGLGANLAPFDERCRVVGGDFFVDVVPGGDAYILKHILHNWDDDRATALLARWRGALGPGARLLVIEGVLPERAAVTPAHQEALLADLWMLATYGGARERTEAEFRALFAAAGFRLTGVVPTGSNPSIIEGVVAG